MSSGVTDASYRAVLRLPHARGVFATGLIARMSLATVSLGLLLTVQQATGSYAIAGTATALFGMVNVVVAPARARLVDRRGPRRVLAVLAIGYAITLLAIAGLATWGAPDWELVMPATAAGLFVPPVGAVMRGVWARLATDPATLSRVYSLDAVAEEALFVTGPLLVGAVVIAASSAAALLLTAALALAGTLAMIRTPATTAAPVGMHPRESLTEGPPVRPLRQPGFVPVLMALLGTGIVLGTLEVAVPAFAQQHHHVAAAGGLLALLSVGSAAGGLLYGHRAWAGTLVTRLLLLTTALVAASTALIAAHSIGLFAVLLLIAGLFLTPTLVTGYLLADLLVPAAAQTEASTWITTASNAGAALSAALTGILIDRNSVSTALGIGAALAVACTGLAATAHKAHRR